MESPGEGGRSSTRTFTTTAKLDRDPLVVVLGKVQNVLLLGSLAALAIAAACGLVVVVLVVSAPATAPMSSTTTTASATTAAAEVASSSAAAASVPPAAIGHLFSLFGFFLSWTRLRCVAHRGGGQR